MILLGIIRPSGLGDRSIFPALSSFSTITFHGRPRYQNGSWVVGSAKCGREEGFNMIGQARSRPLGRERCHVQQPRGPLDCPSAAASTSAIATITTSFNFAAHRDHIIIKLITEARGRDPTARLSQQHP